MNANYIAARSRRWVPLAALVLSCSYCTTVKAQTLSPPKACAELMVAIAQNPGGSPDSFADLRGGTVVCFWELALPKLPLSLALQAQAALQKRAATIQTGAPTGSNGTTSAVSKPITPLSLATEYGGITSSTSNQTTTFQASLDGIPAAFGSKGLVPYCWSPVITIPGCVESSTLQALSRIGVGVTANTAGSSQSVKGTAAPSQGTAQQASLSTAGTTGLSFSGAIAKFTILRGKYAPGAAAPTYTGKNINDAQDKIIVALKAFPLGVYNTDPANYGVYQQWQRCVVKQFSGKDLKDPTTRNKLFAKYWVQVVGILFASGAVNCSDDAPIILDKDISRPIVANRQTQQRIVVPHGANLTEAQNDLIDAVDGYLAAISIFESQVDDLLRASAPALALEYDYSTPLNQPTTSTAKVVFSYSGWKEKCANKASADDKASSPNSTINRLTGTLNAGGNFYNSTPSAVPGAGAFRAAQVGTEVDYAICTRNENPILSFLGNATVGLTYYYQDQVSPSILKVTPGLSIVGLNPSTSSVFAKKGPINFVQLKYGLGVGKNVKFPIAVSWSNRTDLITRPLWSAQFGVSYDFSSLFSSSGSTDASSGSKGNSQ